jgi:hypothetical protein
MIAELTVSGVAGLRRRTAARAESINLREDFVRKYVDVHHPQTRPLRFPESTALAYEDEIITMTYADFAGAIRDALEAGLAAPVSA